MAMLVHRAEEAEKLTAKGKRALAQLLGPRINDALILPKYDGVYVQMLHQHGEWRGFSRTGERLFAAETDDRRYALDKFGNTDLVYIGELWAANMPHAQINGLARKKTPQDELSVVVHDTYSRSSIIVHGKDDLSYLGRWARAKPIKLPGAFRNASFSRLQELTDDYRMEVLLDMAKAHVQNGAAEGWAYDGLILRDEAMGFIPGRGADGGIYKLKPRKSLDLRVVSEFVEARETKLGGFVTVEYRGVPTDVGSGLTQQMLGEISKATYDMTHDGEKAFVGRIVEVEFLDFTKDGKLREPVLKSIRWDKAEPDA